MKKGVQAGRIKLPASRFGSYLNAPTAAVSSSLMSNTV